MTNTCTARASSKATLWAGLLSLLLAGCVDDTASYLIDGSKEHTIMLRRVQDWFWQDTVALTIAASRLPDCHGGIDIEDVPRSAPPRALPGTARIRRAHLHPQDRGSPLRHQHAKLPGAGLRGAAA